jgi:large subunit ribosomal protein L22
MEAKAIARTITTTPMKTRLVVDLIRGKNVKEAQAILMFTPRGVAPIVLKVLNSAIANAVNNNKQDEKNLYVKEIYVCEGIKRKLMLPRAKGKGDILRKRTSHITVVVADKE